MLINRDFWLATLALILFCLAVGVREAPAAEVYIAAGGGFSWCPETHNDDELECGSERGPVGEVAGGLQFPNWRIEIGLQYSEANIHGANGNGCNQRSCSADNMDENVLRGIALMASAWRHLRIVGPLEAYAGVGIGGAYLSALGDSAVAPTGQLGAGLIACSRRLCGDLGYRYVRSLDVDLAGQEARLHRHGPMARLIWRFHA